jgi:MoaA/NifB/PqqE/SkfB family radical SAM enzyme
VPLLDIVLGYDCNLACSYCTITDPMRLRSLPTARVAQELARAAAAGFRDASFTGGEPTIFRDLPALVRVARRLGFERVKVASNGLRYADARYLDHLVESGVNQFHVSVHARSDAAYDATVRREGAAELRRRALQNLVDRALDPVADLVLKEDTYRDLAAWIEDLAALGIGRFALWFVSLTDGNRGRTEQLPRLTDVAPFVTEAFERARRAGREVTSLHVPRCFVPGYEAHVKHPGEGHVRVVTPDDVFELRDSKLAGGVKPPACSACRFEPRCPGLRADYVEQFGTGEVAPA